MSEIKSVDLYDSNLDSLSSNRRREPLRPPQGRMSQASGKQLNKTRRISIWLVSVIVLACAAVVAVGSLTFINSLKKSFRVEQTYTRNMLLVFS